MTYASDALLMPPFTLADHQLRDTDAARFSRYRTYLDFYNGSQWAEARRPGERRLTVNYGRAFVQKGASYLMGKPVKFELVPARRGDAQAERDAFEAQQFLEGVWDDNGLALADYEAAVDAAVLGDCAFKVTLGREGRIVVRACDVMGLTAHWRADDLRSLRQVNESYEMSAAEIVELFGPAALPARLDDPDRPLRVEERWTDETFLLKINGQVVGERLNSYGFIPYVIVPNLKRPRQFWGLSDLEDIMPLNSEFNVRISILSQLLQMSGNPVLVLENVDSAEGLRVGPGAIWTLPDGAKASLLEMLKDGGVNLAHRVYQFALPDDARPVGVAGERFWSGQRDGRSCQQRGRYRVAAVSGGATGEPQTAHLGRSPRSAQRDDFAAGRTAEVALKIHLPGRVAQRPGGPGDAGGRAGGLEHP